MEALHNLDTSGTSIHPAVARHFLYCGTKIIRARRPFESSDDVGLALVVKTGFNTTKGSLVRSMLFPKPSGFKFYRDSFYYIAVMGMIAFLGFIASLINFIRLGVCVNSSIFGKFQLTILDSLRGTSSLFAPWISSQLLSLQRCRRLLPLAQALLYLD